MFVISLNLTIDAYLVNLFIVFFNERIVLTYVRGQNLQHLLSTRMMFNVLI